MALRDSILIPETRVFAVKRAPVPEGVDPRLGEVLEVLDLGSNVLTLKGRHVLMAKMAPRSGTGALPVQNAYSDTDSWNLKYMSLGSNTGASAADTAQTELDSELALSLKEFTAASAGDVDEITNDVYGFSGLGDIADAYYTHIAWRCMYNAGEGNGSIKEVGLWFADGTANPDGATNVEGGPNTDYPERGPMAARKVLTGEIVKNSSFALEFIWVWMG